MSAQVDAEQTALACVVYQHEGEFGAWVDCSEAVFNFWQRSGTLKSRKLYTSAQQPAAGTYPEQWRLDDRELNAGRLKALHRGLELARKWSAGTGTHGHTDRMVRDMADELRSALSSQDGDYNQQPAPVAGDAMAGVLAALKDARTFVTHAHCQIAAPIGTLEKYDAATAAVNELIEVAAQIKARFDARRAKAFAERGGWQWHSREDEGDYERLCAALAIAQGVQS